MEELWRSYGGIEVEGGVLLLYTGAVCLISCGVVHYTPLMFFYHTM